MFDIEEKIKEIKTDWKEILLEIIQDNKEEINKELSKEYDKFSENYIFPPQNLIFNAFNHFDIKDTKCLIIGQDPYHNEGEANGLCFSVNEGIKIPASLRNVFKELERCYEEKRLKTDLTDWSKQGVLLLNMSLTVQISKPSSHMKIWNKIMEKILTYINEKMENIVIMAWGNFAKNCVENFDKERNLILIHTHPSPLSRKPFIGCNHFVLCNEYLEEKKRDKIKWL